MFVVLFPLDLYKTGQKIKLTRCIMNIATTATGVEKVKTLMIIDDDPELVQLCSKVFFGA